MSHVVVPPGQLSNGWFENALHDTASCGGCGAQLDVYTTDKAFAGKPAVSTWVCAHKLEDCVRHLADEIRDTRAQLYDITKEYVELKEAMSQTHGKAWDLIRAEWEKLPR